MILLVSKRCSNQFSIIFLQGQIFQSMTVDDIVDIVDPPGPQSGGGGGGQGVPKNLTCKILQCFMDFMVFLTCNDETCCFLIF